jgi:hypothetical protein
MEVLMYGMPGYGYGGIHVRSFPQLIREIKDRQMSRPASTFFILQQGKGQPIRVSVLPNEYIEWNGKAQPQSYERQIEESMQKEEVFLVEKT